MNKYFVYSLSLLAVALSGVAAYNSTHSNTPQNRASSEKEIAYVDSDSDDQGYNRNKGKGKCKVDTSLAIAKFKEDSSNPIAGKNVLIIGASKGNGYGSAHAFVAAGANVIGTSRAPSAPEYAGISWLSPVPIDINDDASVKNFFDTEPTLATWDHIDILVLGGVELSSGALMYSKASDLYPLIATELFGRQRVVERAIKYMQHVDDSRIITFSSILSFYSAPQVPAYSIVKGALDTWVKAWNTEREYYKALTGNYTCKTIAIAAQPSFVRTSLGSLPSTICNPSAPFPYGQYASGIANPFSSPFYAGLFGIVGNSGQQNMEKEELGKAILYIATVRNPEWFYVVLKDGSEKFCSGNGFEELSCLLERTRQHKCRDAIVDYIRGYNWNAAFQNILQEGNSEAYSFYKCPPYNQTAANTPVPPLPGDYPDCSEFTQGVPKNILKSSYFIDLYNNPCKPNYSCP